MRALVSMGVAAALLVPTASFAAVCADRTPAAITAPAAASAKCQATISKSSQGFLATKLKTLGKCMATGVPGACPSAKDTDKIKKAADKAAAKIAKDCDDNAVQAGLVSTAYKTLTDSEVIGSCTLSQHNVTGELLLGLVNGAPNTFNSNADRLKCATTLNKEGVKYTIGVHSAINKCLAAQIKAGVAGNLSPICIGSWAGGLFINPSDTKTGETLEKLAGKLESKIDKDCGHLSTTRIQSIFACPGATTATDLKNCVVCGGYDAAGDAVEQENVETGTFIAPGAGALQTAVNAAVVGEKLLIGSGTYAEEVEITTNDLQLVGCGGASDARPLLVPPAGPGPFNNGIFASGVDGLVFQSLQVGEDGDPATEGDGQAWDENGIFVTGANGVTFRDIIGEGDRTTTYAVFPVVSTNVVVEACMVTSIKDAGIYVGQSDGVIIRYNTVVGNVAGIELENSLNGSMHNNTAIGNAGGILVFQLPSPPLQQGANHEVFFNVSIDNNGDNYGELGSTVAAIPDGTGILVITNKDSEFHHNYARDNHAIGFGLLDQEIVNALVGPPPIFNPTSLDQECTNNLVRDNQFDGNVGLGIPAQNPNPPNTPIASNIVFALQDDQGGNHDNCFIGNGGSATAAFLTASDCTP